MMKKTKKFLHLFMLTAGLAAAGFSALVLNDIRIENVDTTTLDESFVRAYTSLRAGQEIESEFELNAAVAHDVDNLRRSGRFAYVRALVEQDGDKYTLVYKVAARLRLRKIDIIGADGIGNRKINTELGLALGDYVDEALVGEKARAVEAYCRKNKYPDASVVWTLTPDEKNGTAALQLTVAEGEKLRVKRIRFEGERLSGDSFWRRLVPDIFPSQRTASRYEAKDLRKLMQQKQTWWITPWFGAYKPEMKEADLATLRKFYQDRGFLDVKIDGPELKPLGGGKLELVYRIQEGVKYQIGAVGFDGNTLYADSELSKQIQLQSGAVASRTAIDMAAGSVNRYYGNRGYIQNDVRPVIDTDASAGTAAVRFSVREGAQANINEIDIRGNEKTRDEVMRRELAVYPGELFNQQKVETSESRLKNLGYFETVSSSYAPTSVTNWYDLAFKVKEKAMGSFLIGAGFSSVDSLVGFAELSHGNFDIKRWPPVGDGQKMKIRVQAGTQRNDLEVSFVEPWFRDRKLALGVDGYYRTAGYYSDMFDLQTLGSKVSLTKPIFDPFTRGTVSYSLEQFSVDNLTTNAPSEIAADEGAHIKSTVGLSISRDTRDQFFIPTRGNYSSAGVEVSGFGGDEEIYMLEAKTSQFWPVFEDHVFNLKGEVRTVESWGSGSVPIYDRLFLGGPRTIRGFQYRDVSPRSNDPGSTEPIGGLSSWYATAEYTVPLWSKIRGAAFYDIGAVSSTSFDFFAADINSSYGLGVRIDLPMFPLRLDYAIPHITDANNTGGGGRFSFLLGYSF
ncbi:MAG: outer membrane protein assembly factor BamA [Kiritimatiellales bacterium]|nr:outer membrane protein assembly factor BamA [Kiritimatiellales bacterium]